FCFLFLYNTPPTTAIYTLSLHDALPISAVSFDCLIEALALNGEGAGIIIGHAVDQQNGMLDLVRVHERRDLHVHLRGLPQRAALDRKSTRLNSSHVKISYAVFCLKKKTK